MAKREQVLKIEPQDELRFRGPFTGTIVTSYIKLTNPTNHIVYFKIKTTAPKRYCVRPNSGVLKPNAVTQIAVTLQPFDSDPVEKNKHKFMVQTVIAPDDEEENPNVWRDADPDQFMDSKLKCVFENPVANTVQVKIVPTTATTKTEPNTNNGKNKGTGDVKPSPRVLGDTEEKMLVKAAQEFTQLRVEESTLRQENLQLKEELLRLHNAAVGNELASLTAARGLTSQSSSLLTLTPANVVIVIVIAIVSYLLGKMI